MVKKPNLYKNSDLYIFVNKKIVYIEYFLKLDYFLKMRIVTI